MHITRTVHLQLRCRVWSSAPTFLRCQNTSAALSDGAEFALVGRRIRPWTAMPGAGKGRMSGGLEQLSKAVEDT